ncbi:MAG: Na/Pi cotransporter family protein [Alphaproteobacteria bacterium]
MSGTHVLISLLGGVALLLWGLRMVRTGMTRALGANLVGVLETSLRSRPRAFFSGLGVTMLVQSSTATALLTASLAGRNLVATAPAIAVLLGADVGTTLVAQVLSYNLSALAPVFIFVGVTAFLLVENRRVRNMGRIGIGLGLMLMALGLIVGATAPMRDSPTAIQLLGALTDEPVIAILVGLLLTWSSYSSLAIVLLIGTLAASQVIPVEPALYVVLGANAGASLPPLTATLQSSPQARQPVVGNMLFRVFGCIVAALFVGKIVEFLPLFGADPVRQVINFHMGFNIALAIVCLPFVAQMARLTSKLLPPEPADQAQGPSVANLDRSVLNEPTIALANVTREVLRMGEVLEEMLSETRRALDNSDAALAKQVIQKDDVVDDFYRAIKSYLADVRSDLDDEATSNRCLDIMNFTTHLEHAGDIIELSLNETVRSAIKRGVTLDAKESEFVAKTFQQVQDNMSLSLSVFLSGDANVARRLLENKRALSTQERKSVTALHARMRRGEATTDGSALSLDILRDLKHINSHMTSAAYPILEASDELYSSRLKKRKTS